jgi:salicylate hydroxylase
MSTIRVAIVGGGLAGIALLRGLLRYSHIAADIYEARPSFKEERPGLNLSPLAQAVLRAIDPSIDTCLDRAGAVYTTSEVRMATGPFSGQRIDSACPSTDGKRSVGRQNLLTELLSAIPPRMVHLNTRVTSILEASPGNGLTLTLSDGSQKRYDVVIGSDGVHGKTRNFVIGPDDPAQDPKSSGFWGLPVKVSFDRARQLIGSDVLDARHPRQITWIGDGTTMQQDVMNNGNDVQITITAKYDSADEEFSWAKLFTPEEFEQIFANNDCPPCQGIVKVTAHQRFPPTAR